MAANLRLFYLLNQVIFYLKQKKKALNKNLKS